MKWDNGGKPSKKIHSYDP